MAAVVIVVGPHVDVVVVELIEISFTVLIVEGMDILVILAGI